MCRIQKRILFKEVKAPLQIYKLKYEGINVIFTSIKLFCLYSEMDVNQQHFNQ